MRNYFIESARWEIINKPLSHVDTSSSTLVTQFLAGPSKLAFWSQPWQKNKGSIISS